MVYLKGGNLFVQGLGCRMEQDPPVGMQKRMPQELDGERTHSEAFYERIAIGWLMENTALA